MPKLPKIFLLAISILLVFAVFLGVNSSGVKAASNGADDAYKQIDVYTEVLRHIQTDYVTEPNIPAVTNGAMRGLLEKLDVDSSYLTPDEYKAYKDDKGGKAQVGINISKRYGYAAVVSVVPGSPADKAGLTDGDVLESIEGKDTMNISLAMIQKMLEGAPGSTLNVGVVRPNKAEPDKIAMVRVLVQEPPVQVSAYDNTSILYLKPEILDREHVDQVEARLKGMQKAGNKKILLDLRDIAAGDMAQATRLANMLLPAGDTITTLEGQKFPKQVFTAERDRTIQPSAPVVVLVNRGTSGPAEVVAAALLDNKRADLVGERTFGEGAEQKTFDLPDGGAIILSVAKYASPSGKKLQDNAVTPNIVVASNADQDDELDDEAPAQSNAPATANKPTVQVDDQLTKAIDVLKGKAA